MTYERLQAIQGTDDTKHKSWDIIFCSARAIYQRCPLLCQCIEYSIQQQYRCQFLM